jgi:hypothetical protein
MRPGEFSLPVNSGSLDFWDSDDWASQFAGQHPVKWYEPRRPRWLFALPGLRRWKHRLIWEGEANVTVTYEAAE